MGRKVAMYSLTTTGDSWSGAQIGALEGATWMFGWRGMSLGGRWLARTPLAVRASEAVSYGASRVMDGLKRSAQGLKVRVYHAATASVLSLEVMFSSIPRLPRVPGAVPGVVRSVPRAVDAALPWAGAVERGRSVSAGVRRGFGVVRPVLIHGVRGAAAGAAVNAVVYPVTFVLNPADDKQWDWDGYKAGTVTAAVGNGLGGFASPVAGSLAARFSGRGVGFRRSVIEYSWAVGSGYTGMYVGNAYFGRPVSYGDVAYYGLANVGIAWSSGYVSGMLARSSGRDPMGAGRGSLGSFGRMGRPLGWGGYPKDYRGVVASEYEWGLRWYPYIGASWAGGADFVKTNMVDYYISDISGD